MRRLTVSRVPLALVCGFPWSDAAPEWNERPVGKEARAGTVTHRLSDAYVKTAQGTPTTADLSDMDPEAIAEGTAYFEGSLRGWLAKRTWTHSELGVAYDAESDTAKQCKPRGPGGYEGDGDDTRTIVRGSLDLLEQWRDDSDRICLDVVDIKTGQAKNAHREQLIAQAVGASRLFDPHLVRIGFVFPRKTKVIEPEWETLDRDALDAEAGRLRKTLRSLPTAQPKPGDHCFRCPMGRGLCPAYEVPEMPADVAARFDEAG